MDNSEIRRDAERFRWWFSPLARIDFDAYLAGVRERWTVDQWRSFIDMQMGLARPGEATASPPSSVDDTALLDHGVMLVVEPGRSYRWVWKGDLRAAIRAAVRITELDVESAEAMQEREATETRLTLERQVTALLAENEKLTVDAQRLRWLLSHLWEVRTGYNKRARLAEKFHLIVRPGPGSPTNLHARLLAEIDAAIAREAKA